MPPLFMRFQRRMERESIPTDIAGTILRAGGTVGWFHAIQRPTTEIRLQRGFDDLRDELANGGEMGNPLRERPTFGMGKYLAVGQGG